MLRNWMWDWYFKSMYFKIFFLKFSLVYVMEDITDNTQLHTYTHNIQAQDIWKKIKVSILKKLNKPFTSHFDQQTIG